MDGFDCMAHQFWLSHSHGLDTYVPTRAVISSGGTQVQGSSGKRRLRDDAKPTPYPRDRLDRQDVSIVATAAITATVSGVTLAPPRTSCHVGMPGASLTRSCEVRDMKREPEAR